MAMQGSEQQRPPAVKRVTLKLTTKKHEYGDVYSYAFLPEEPLPYNAGQYVHVVVDIADPAAKRVRELSFSSAPHEPEIMFSIDGRSNSPYQQAFKALEPGDAVQLFKSKQHMLWPVIEECVVFIAGGIGITPFRSMCLDKQHSQVRMRVEIIHASGTEHLFADELEPLVESYQRTERAGLPQSISGCLERNPDARYYIAGSPAFVESVNASLLDGGISHKKIHMDEFKGYEENWDEV